MRATEMAREIHPPRRSPPSCCSGATTGPARATPSYPTAVEFHEGVDARAYESKLAEADAVPDEPLSLYFHLPFCRERCTFCGCSVIITANPGSSERYLDYLGRRSRWWPRSLPHRRRVNQIHWGGGTPTHLDVDGMRALWEAISRRFTLVPGAEVAIEVDPRVTTHEQIDTLRGLGFNRLSMGVQDFTPEVQEAIGRHQGVEETVDLLRYGREAGFDSINVDLVYGFRCSERELRGEPRTDGRDAPRPRGGLQLRLHALDPGQPEADSIPRPSRRPQVEVRAVPGQAMEAFTAAGYRQIGMDHFALPDDEIAVAQREGRLHRNFMGYTVMPAADQLGFGSSSIGDLRGAFVQNLKKLVDLLRGDGCGTAAGRARVSPGRRRQDPPAGHHAPDVQFRARHGARSRRGSGSVSATTSPRELEELRGAGGHGFVEVTGADPGDRDGAAVRPQHLHDLRPIPAGEAGRRAAGLLADGLAMTGGRFS